MHAHPSRPSPIIRFAVICGFISAGLIALAIMQRLVTSSNAFAVVIFSLFSLFGVMSMIREGVHRRKAGPIRFRLPPASMANPPRGAVVSAVVLALVALLGLPLYLSRRNWSALAVTILFLAALLNQFQALLPRRHAQRWLLLAFGLLGLLIGAMTLAIGLGVTPTLLDFVFTGVPRVLVIVISVVFFAVAAGAIREWLWGTLVREGAIEIFGRTHPPSRIIFKGWQEGEGGSMLRLAVRAPRLFEMPFGEDREFAVPVPAAERPALEAFLESDGCGS
jgi:hypothetical protein